MKGAGQTDSRVLVTLLVAAHFSLHRGRTLVILILPGGREKYAGNVSCIQTARGTAGPTAPAPKSRFLQVSGQVGTLQAAIRHSLDIQGQCPCLLGIVPRLTMATPTCLLQLHQHYYVGRYRSLSCA